MNLEIKIVLTDDDVAAGKTMGQAIAELFPVLPPLDTSDWSDEAHNKLVEKKGEAVRYSTGSVVPNRDAGEVPQTQADADALNPPDTDTSGVPWVTDLHNSNRKQYGSGKDKGRWMWKRGSNEDTREEEALQLAESYQAKRAITAEIAAGHADATPVVTPVAENASPLQDWEFPAFLAAMTAAGSNAEAVLVESSKHGVKTIPELAHPDNKTVLGTVAAAFGWVH